MWYILAKSLEGPEPVLEWPCLVCGEQHSSPNLHYSMPFSLQCPIPLANRIALIPITRCLCPGGQRYEAMGLGR